MADFDQTKASLIETMRAGIASQFWGELVKITTENIAMLEKQIITKRSLEPGHENEDLSDLEVDRLRDKRSALEDLINMPAEIIRESMREDAPEDEHDPYPKTVADLRSEPGRE